MRKIINPGGRLIVGAAREHPLVLLSICILTFFFAAADLAGPLVMRALVALIERGAQASPDSFLVLAAIAVGVYAGRGLLNAGLGYATSYLGATVSAEIRSRLYGHIQTLPPVFFGSRHHGGLLANIVTDVNQIQPLVATFLPDVLIRSVLVLGTAAILLSLNVPLALGIITSMGLFFLAFRSVSRQIRNCADAIVARRAAISALLSEHIGRMELIQIYAWEKKEYRRFEAANQAFRQSLMRLQRVFFTRYPAVETLGNVGTVIVIVVGGAMLSAGYLSLPDLVAFALYSGYFFRPMSSLIKMIENAQRGLASADCVAQLLYQKSSVRSPLTPVQVNPKVPRIEFRHVHFGYPGRPPVLQDLSLRIPEFQTVGLVGASGAGKSTITRLIARLFDVDRGEVLVSGVDVKHWALDDLRRLIAVVPQEPNLFHSTIAENIAYAEDGAGRQEIEEAAKAAGAAAFISRLPHKYETVVGERGGLLSLGQQQRIALARALVRRSPILILDEPTSALDAKTEQEIVSTIKALSGLCTIIIIAHRLSTVRCADRVLVLDQGRLMEQGTHDELMRNQGPYYRLAVSMAANQEAANPAVIEGLAS